ncbi:conserved hypothetical protein [Aspergillus terreus NIH2624]|uniref:Queuosine 5'-phosphate N-glycosylase/hydrolase n=1 Tax=Aspergillus terreus (strain NIH 2624 / FGSC A1156) TaxID=341663 RepID=Q0CVC2_ASPTN|nr:uncharacterized protein ATEG_02362 [Aspergillus terreus NIH2624]EAU37324.1 conserved hypothetical protein [Aspergillus terreus NIH2624]
MSDDEADPELLALLRKSLGLGGGAANPHTAETKVLENSQYVFDNAIDVALSPVHVKDAADKIWRNMQKKRYSTQSWADHELHPQSKDESTVDFIFTMDLLNFSFWSELPDDKRFAIEYRGKRWTGYWSLVAALQRALDDGIPITTPEFWTKEDECTEALLKHVFRSATEEEIPLLSGTAAMSAGSRLGSMQGLTKQSSQDFDGSFLNCIYDANYSAAALVNLLTENFSCFRDETSFEGRRVRFYKRAQILIADLWACFNGQSFGEFRDIDKITMFADYRIPQALHQLGCLKYSPPLESHIRQRKLIPSGSTWETEIRATSIWCVELIRQAIERQYPEARAMFQPTKSPKPADNHHTNGYVDAAHLDAHKKCTTQKHWKQKSVNEPTASGVNAILIDFFLYDTMKELELKQEESIPHHRTRSIWY